MERICDVPGPTGLRSELGPPVATSHPAVFSTSDLAGMSTGPAEIVETHISLVFLVGDYVYKARKPVRFGFVDFTRRVDRLADCQRELVLNRRLAPDVYVGVADVVLGGQPIDHVVVMRRLPATRQLSGLALENVALGNEIGEVARTLTTFHASAERSPEISSAATAAAVRGNWDALFAETTPFVGPALDRGADDEIRHLAARWLAGRAPLLVSRIEGGWICDGHGDLQADDVYCLDDGVRILDCLEFSNRLRDGDVAADVAFLVMDLERLGRTDAASHLLQSYEECSGCRIPRSLVHHYCAQRAYVRAAVACLSSPLDAVAIARARTLHRLSLRHLRDGRVVMVLVGGLPGTGKTTVARLLADAYGWRVLSSDVVRDELFPLAHDDEHTRRARHHRPATEATYGELLRRARGLVEAGESVILDASWTDAQLRRDAHAMAADTSTDVLELECTCTDDVARERMASRRAANTHDPSDATPEIRRAMAHRADPWVGAVAVDTSIGTPADTLTKALAAVPWRFELREFNEGARR